MREALSPISNLIYITVDYSTNFLFLCPERSISVRHKIHLFCSMDSESASVCELNLSHKQTRQRREAIHLPSDSTVLVQTVSSLSMSPGVCDVVEIEVVLKTVITLPHLSFISQGVSGISPAYLRECEDAFQSISF